MKLFTIGFTQRSAEDFFTRLRDVGVRRVVDVRLNNTSQLAGFAKSRDLQYFLKAIAGIDYLHIPEFAPTQSMLDDLKKKKGVWNDYERHFDVLLRTRNIAAIADATLQDTDCLLCSEFAPDFCHRRLIAEHLQQQRDGIEVIHL